MKITLISVGSRMPEWVEAGVAEYRKRLPREFEFRVAEIPLSQRSKTTNLVQAIAKEGEASLKAVGPGDYLIALDVKGKVLATEAWAQRLGQLRDEGRNVSLLVGGPDGLAPECLNRADAVWSLSALTFPHPVVRVIVAEQIYRAWSLLHNHPYHRA
ncbi:MAG TPA: 23S rRNA (pseudouridine(1915)-N(3))-methyltransferase RlmH [Candidatus Acidoferrum sp.]|nr:23S rRNA (pseudouridine(1915)-N(3))-methyltransferase RlmH [Candidatus Acidoferrum sp.]